MQTPIADFVRTYAASGTSRLHMPGHKGIGPLGCEMLDITEICGADALYEASGIIAQSEANAAALFGSGQTVYSTEGSSQCIRAMLFLALTGRSAAAKPVIVAARNVHKAFVSACALLDLDVVWLYPDSEAQSLCACPITPETLERTLRALDTPPAAVYLTAPDYLGGSADLSACADVCHRHNTLLAVDNAHGAYLHFLPSPAHPLDLGADLCCDSAHKTLPVLTGGAYLHISSAAPAALRANARQAMALFGSTSPSYLTLASLDACNRYLAGDFSRDLSDCIARLDAMRAQLRQAGWQVEPSDPLRITIRAPHGTTGTALSERLRAHQVECEFADPDYLVLMATPGNPQTDFDRIVHALGRSDCPADRTRRSAAAAERVMSIREAIFAPHETVRTEDSLGRICAAPTVSCPPAVPVVISGERIGTEALALLRHYGITELDVVSQ